VHVRDGLGRIVSGLVLACAALALGGCADEGSGEAETSGATTTASPAAGDRPAPRAGDATEPGARGEGAGGEPADAAAGEQARDDGCRFEAPPGRLGERTVTVELTSVSCREGTRLARAAALGQPAGANIPVEHDGFRCEPSTRERGVDVTYTCSQGPRRASFRISWSAAEPGKAP
jgi:hypothetical protein